eukprot:gnl/Trimastix_PCT/3167.p1 GENE.gnl/Trimastix_PCT/3167~~gnl/Trimastix_PCT/3167.p1  ORF type:complete len:188 (+),score=37.81 gnl/Trimastix_PCT/3167:76-639(+)
MEDKEPSPPSMVPPAPRSVIPELQIGTPQTNIATLLSETPAPPTQTVQTSVHYEEEDDSIQELLNQIKETNSLLDQERRMIEDETHNQRTMIEMTQENVRKGEAILQSLRESHDAMQEKAREFNELRETIEKQQHAAADLAPRTDCRSLFASTLLWFLVVLLVFCAALAAILIGSRADRFGASSHLT